MHLSAAPFPVPGAPRLSTQRWLECETGRTRQMRSQEVRLAVTTEDGWPPALAARRGPQVRRDISVWSGPTLPSAIPNGMSYGDKHHCSFDFGQGEQVVGQTLKLWAPGIWIPEANQPGRCQVGLRAGHAAAKFPPPSGAGGYRELRRILARRRPLRAGVQLRGPQRPRGWLVFRDPLPDDRGISRS
jgi:hypothetical protein